MICKTCVAKAGKLMWQRIAEAFPEAVITRLAMYEAVFYPERMTYLQMTAEDES